MKHILLSILMLSLLLPLLAITSPRVYVQKLVLENGKNPSITWDKDKSAKEYTLKAWINTKPDEIISTEINPINTIAIKQAGNGVKMPFTVIAVVQLGNFPQQWLAGEILHLEITHRKSGQIFSWKQVIPSGTALIKMLDEPIVIPPYAKPKK
ncbi:MAG: hypothetical protein RBS43_04160 [Candidatus Cloacimonas sp.]|jgi:hypothetical protein|nr:hypothetical protein [Candidatus Cloacimonas sp.]